MSIKQDRRRRRQAWLIAIPSAAAVIGGIAVVLSTQKAAERLAYQSAVSGSPCPAVTTAPSYVHLDELKTAGFQDAQFDYLRGDLDCRTGPVGDLAGDHAAYCIFDRPGYLRVVAGPAHAAYLIVIGQAVVSRRGVGPWRCTVKPPP